MRNPVHAAAGLITLLGTAGPAWGFGHHHQAAVPVVPAAVVYTPAPTPPPASWALTATRARVMPVGPLYLQAYAAPVVYQWAAPAAVAPAEPFGLAAPLAAPLAATAPDASLRRLTADMQALTRVVERQTELLTDHEQRLGALEVWAQGGLYVPPTPQSLTAPRRR